MSGLELLGSWKLKRKRMKFLTKEWGKVSREKGGHEMRRNVFKLSLVGWFFWPEAAAKIKINTEDYIYWCFIISYLARYTFIVSVIKC